MHIPITIPLILSLTQLTSAIPYTTTSTSSTATSSLPPKEAISSSIAHETPSAFGAAGIKNNTAACPPSHASKQCCTNLGDQVEDILGQLGEVVPIVGEVTASSRTGLSCNAVVENSECGLSLMCCSGKPGRPKEDDETPSEGQQEPGTQSIFQSGCMPFNEAIELGKKEAAAAASSSVLARASHSASASASATPSSSRLF